MRKTFAVFLILLLIERIHVEASKRDFYYYHKSLMEEFLALLSNEKTVEHTTTRQPRTSVLTADDLDLDLLNKLNDEDIKKMPQITDYSDENRARGWLIWYFRIAKRYRQIGGVLSWRYETNITKENEEAEAAQSLRMVPFNNLASTHTKKYNEYMKNSDDEDLRRIFGRLAQGSPSHNDDDLKRVSHLHSEMSSIYSTTEVCEVNDPKKCYQLSPYLERLMQVEKDYDRLTWAWKGWHDNCGNAIRPLYLETIDLMNKNCRENGYKDLSEEWIEEYEMGNPKEFEKTVDALLKDIMPLYKELHAYVRGRLCEIYPNRFDCQGPIPGHLLGNMWAQQWHERFPDIIPYADAPLINLTKALNDKHYTIDQIYKTAEDFFTSIGLYPMTSTFWEKSLFKKPTDRDVVCHASASDMCVKDDLRVKVCTQIDDEYFYTVHHEMGHVEYYMAYDEAQPFVYRDGANSGFHEAIGDTIGMFAISPIHQVTLNLLSEDRLNSHYEINYLLRIAMQKVAFLPFGYVLDKYRFALFRGEIDREHELNSMWWAMRIEYGGVMAAVHRSDAVNFDPGAKYHVPSGTPYFRYFIAHFLQFQFYRSLCQLKGHRGPLYLCDIYQRKDVGEKFKAMLALGSSKSWEDILQSLNGERKLSADALLEYFDPLYKWLKDENKRRGYRIGWM